MRLADIAHARSGDKGDRADIGVFAYDEAGYARIKQALTPERVRAHFAWLQITAAHVYPLDNLLAVKIVLDGALSGNAARNLRSDNLGKTIAAALLRMEL
ncbi:MAG: hypothetical protein NZL99_03850 [Burkholderiaceae bacterium]|nr:hypothetical protein [Burkholderiaceae bacterium]MCS7100811.1 hypothetical protein [Burkholderiaceae bacterium]MCX7902709.1 hypothetical protein [Burkholderiaceae bacterium]MDW8429788.1 hypothetical protein [Sutterellaceae bacterium]